MGGTYGKKVESLCGEGGTFLCKYLRKKSSRNDFPFLKAPATETTTTFLSRRLSRRRISSTASVGEGGECGK